MAWRAYYVSTFSGIEAATVAWAPLGWVPVCFSEIDPFPSAVLEERFPSVPNLGDITRIDWSDLSGFVDVVVGGSPCQSFSIAGNREGLSGESGLMWEYVRAVQEIRPEWLVWENVPGALSSSGGEDFRCLLESLDALGYGLAWRVLDAQFFGVAQRRRRVFLVGHLGDRRAAEVLFEPEGLRWNHASSREKRKALTGGSEGGARTVLVRCGKPGGGKGAPVQNDVSATLSTSNTQTLFKPVCMADAASNAAIDVDMAGTVTAHSAKQPLIVANGYEVRKLTPMECERLQGFPDDWTLVPYRGMPADRCPDTPRYRAIGNSMAVPVMRWIGKRIQEVADREETEE